MDALCFHIWQCVEVVVVKDLKGIKMFPDHMAQEKDMGISLQKHFFINSFSTNTHTHY